MGGNVPTVSVVIPTFRRPELVMTAVRSALAQTLDNIEVIVVLATADETTERNLRAIGDPRLRVLPSGGMQGPSAARNRGIQASTGHWVALLDDDDHWLPDKLRRQLEVASRSVHRRPLVSCGMLVRDGRTERHWPRRLPASGESVPDYLFRRKTVMGACAFLQTSTLFAPRELFLEVPFREDLQVAEDLDWAIRAGTRDQVGVEFVMSARPTCAEPLTVWNIDPDRRHESSAHNWGVMLTWIRGIRNLVSPEAYASFLLTWVSRQAAQSRAGFGTFWDLGREAVQNGRPSALDIAVHFGHWLVPQSRLQRISSWFTGR